MRIKICGITNLGDALHAAKLGADALGFVFYEPSPRYIIPSKAREIIEQLPPFVERVGLFVNTEPDAINTIVQQTGISTAQIHFDVDAPFLDAIEIPAGIKAIPYDRGRIREQLENHQRSLGIDHWINALRKTSAAGREEAQNE